jgi:hypothetical protein
METGAQSKNILLVRQVYLLEYDPLDSGRSSPSANNASLNYLGTPDSDDDRQPCAFFTHTTAHATASCDDASSDDNNLDSDFAWLVFPYLPITLLFIIWVLQSPYAPILWFSLGWLLYQDIETYLDDHGVHISRFSP